MNYEEKFQEIIKLLLKKAKKKDSKYIICTYLEIQKHFYKKYKETITYNDITDIINNRIDYYDDNNKFILSDDSSKKYKIGISNIDFNDNDENNNICFLYEDTSKIDDNISKREEEINNLIIKRKRLLAPLLILATLRRYTSKNNPLNKKAIFKHLNDHYSSYFLEESSKEGRKNPNEILSYSNFTRILNDLSYERFFRGIEEKKPLDLELTVFKNGNEDKYYTKSIFTENEILLLSGAIEVYNYITAEDTINLISKLNSILPNSSKYDLKSTDLEKFKFYKIDALKLDEDKSNGTLNNIKIIREAIKEKKKLCINYGKYSVEYDGISAKKFNLIPKNKNLIEEDISPYELMWSNGYYYLIASNSQKSIAHYRVDRIINLKKIDDSITPIKEVVDDTQEKYYLSGNKINIGKYRATHPIMYYGEIKRIEIECKNYLINNILDSFGFNVEIKKISDEWCKVFINSTEEGAVLWATQYCTDCKIVSPKTAIEKIKQRLEKGLSNYSKEKDKED